MVRIAIVEDEKIYVQQLQEYIERYQREREQQIKVTVFSDGIDITEKYCGGYDIILMDIQMKYMDGMTAAEKIRTMDEEVIIMFITNMTQYAIRGYEVDALDYVVKPVEYFAFSQKLDKAIARIKKHDGSYITISTEVGLQKLMISDIYCIESQGHNAIYRTIRGDYTSRAVLKEIESDLSKHGFYRCSKGYLVNMKQVEGVSSGNCVIHGSKIPISRAKKKEFMDLMLHYMNEE